MKSYANLKRTALKHMYEGH